MRFLESVPLDEKVELQPIAFAPFFDDKIELAIKEFDPDLIVLDLRLTRGEDDGFRILRRLKGSSLRDIPVIVCSKYIGHSPDDKNRKKAISMGADDALPKIPFPDFKCFLNHAR